MPHNIKPMLATLIKHPFDDPDWVFEIKFDGYRAIAEIEKGKVNLHSRNNISFNKKFSPVTESLKAFEIDVILDGEIVVIDELGKANFQYLQNYQTTGKGDIVYYVFDILYSNGKDLTGLSLIERKTILRDLMPELPNVLFSDHIENKGKDFFEAARENKLEGIIAKNSSSRYQVNKRSKDWLKIKTSLRQEAVIGGYTGPKGSRKKFGALILGIYEKDELIYIGHSGGGFTEKDLDFIHAKLKPLQIDHCPFKIKPKTNTPAKWVSPEMVCEVSFSEWTEDGAMRHPVFIGLREDKDPKEVKKELPAASRNAKEKVNKSTRKTGKLNNKDKISKENELNLDGNKVTVTNLNKVYWPEEGYTKGDLIDYYKKAAKFILPYLKDRPESLLRHPNGINEKGFFQKDVGDMPPDWVDTREIHSESNNKDINYLIVNNAASLIYIANFGCIEINPWFSRVQSLDNPDYTVLDLDPVDIEFDKVIETALEIKKVLDKVKTKCYCKTSGATGLHIYIPLAAKYSYEEAKEFSHIIAQIVHNRIPDFTSLERSPSKRKNKVYIDYLQNNKGQTLAAPYSVRPKPGAPVATPLKWSEVKKGLDPKNYNIKNIFRRLSRTGDLFKYVLGKGVNIEKVLDSINKLYT